MVTIIDPWGFILICVLSNLNHLYIYIYINYSMLDIKNNSNLKEVYRQKKKKILLPSHPPLKLKLILLLLFLLSE